MTTPDLSTPREDDDEYFWADGPGGFGCVHCSYDGWRHGCCDDMCIGCNEPEWCDDAIPCRHCNPHGEIR